MSSAEATATPSENKRERGGRDRDGKGGKRRDDRNSNEPREREESELIERLVGINRVAKVVKVKAALVSAVPKPAKFPMQSAKPPIRPNAP